MLTFFDVSIEGVRVKVFLGSSSILARGVSLSIGNLKIYSSSKLVCKNMDKPLKRSLAKHIAGKGRLKRPLHTFGTLEACAINLSSITTTLSSKLLIFLSCLPSITKVLLHLVVTLFCLSFLFSPHLELAEGCRDRWTRWQRNHGLIGVFSRLWRPYLELCPSYYNSQGSKCISPQ